MYEILKKCFLAITNSDACSELKSSTSKFVSIIVKSTSVMCCSLSLFIFSWNLSFISSICLLFDSFKSAFRLSNMSDSFNKQYKRLVDLKWMLQIHKTYKLQVLLVYTKSISVNLLETAILYDNIHSIICFWLINY